MPKCDTPMRPGFAIDRGENHHSRVQEWIPGAPRESIWFGPATRQQRIDAIPIITLRCPTCGFLESYAPPPKH